QTHFNLLPGGKVRPATIAHHVEGHETIVHDAIFSGESLEGLKLHIRHRSPSLTIKLGYGLLSKKRSIETIESGRCKANISRIQLTSSFAMPLCFAMKMTTYTG